MKEKEEWKFATEEFGAPSVTHSGTTVKLKLYVGNKDILPLVSSMTGQGILSINYGIMFNILGAETLANAHFGSGTGPLLLDGLSCTGTEANLLSCYHRGIGVTGYNCTHSDAAGIRCQGILIFVFFKCNNLDSW